MCYLVEPYSVDPVYQTYFWLLFGLQSVKSFAFSFLLGLSKLKYLTAEETGSMTVDSIFS